MTSDQIILWTFVIAVAIVCDLLLNRWLRRTWQARGVNVIAKQTQRAAVAVATVLDRPRRWLISAGKLFQPESWRRRWQSARAKNPLAAFALSSAAPAVAASPAQAAHPTILLAASDQAPEGPAATSRPARATPAESLSVATPRLPGPDASQPLPADAPVSARPEPVEPPGLLPVEQMPLAVARPIAEFSVPVAGSTMERSNSDLVARVNITVELPVGATIRLTIESGPGGVTTITQSPLPSQLAAPAAPLANPSRSALREPAPVPAAPALASQRALGAPRASSALQPAGRVSRFMRTAILSPIGHLNGAWRVNWPRWRQALGVRVNMLPQVLFWASVTVYLLTRLIGIDRYPIYFFTDEAVHTVLAADFLHAGLQNSDHEFLPTFFSLGPSFNLNGVSVYLQTIPYLLFGKSEFVTRATSALVTVIAAVAVGLILRDIFKRRYWWTATLLLAIAPAWFLHSRTAFEYIEVAAYYAGFLYCYLRYRYISPRSLYGVIIFAALAFYTHGLGQILMGVITVLLAVSDWRYHWQQRATIAKGLILGLVLLVPYVRYSLAHPSSAMDQLRQRGSYWVTDGLPFGSKLSQFLSEYLLALSPKFWFLPNNGRDIQRHVMPGYGNLWLPTLPLLVLGLAYALRTLRSSSSRTLLLAIVAAPVGSALVAIGIPRVLWEIIPLTLLSAIGLCLALEWLEDHHVQPAALAVGAFVVLAGVNVYMLRDALVNGGVWSTDYTLDGTQFGARQVFGEAVPQFLAEHPDAQVIVSATWANGTEMFVPFFLTPLQISHVRLESLDYFLTAQRDLPPNLEVVLPVYEYNKAIQNPKLADIVVDKTIPYPNGQPGFYFLRLNYSTQAASLFAAEEAALLKPVVETYTLDGQNVIITHPTFGAGQLHDMLDGSRYTLINAPGFNPLTLDFAFPAARPMTGLTLITGSLPDFTVTATVYSDSRAAPQIYSQRFVGLPPDPTVMLDFNKGPSSVVRLHLDIYNDLGGGPNVNIHVREVQFR